jgi:hypothetical protein
VARFKSLVRAFIVYLCTLAAGYDISSGGRDSYMPLLLEEMDITEIPAEIGGEMQNAPWCGPFDEKYGSSEAQINAKAAEMQEADRRKTDFVTPTGVNDVTEGLKDVSIAVPAAVATPVTENSEKTDLEELS